MAIDVGRSVDADQIVAVLKRRGVERGGAPVYVRCFVVLPPDPHNFDGGKKNEIGCEISRDRPQPSA